MMIATRVLVGPGNMAPGHAIITAATPRAMGLAGLGDLNSDAEAAATKAGYPVTCRSVRTPLPFIDPNSGHGYYDQDICTRPGDPAGYNPRMIISHPEVFVLDVQRSEAAGPQKTDILAWARPKPGKNQEHSTQPPAAQLPATLPDSVSTAGGGTQPGNISTNQPDTGATTSNPLLAGRFGSSTTLLLVVAIGGLLLLGKQ